jgi:hypothetical protein
MSPSSFYHFKAQIKNSLHGVRLIFAQHHNIIEYLERIHIEIQIESEVALMLFY